VPQRLYTTLNFYRRQGCYPREFVARPKPSIAIVGPGALGSSLALSLRAAGYPLVAVSGRTPARAHALARRVKARARSISEAPFGADIVWVCVPDDSLASVANTLARAGDWEGRVVLHSSGARSSDELSALRQRGASAGSLHPMMTFTRGAVRTMTGVPFAVEGDPAAARLARQIARDLGGIVFPIRKQDKALYHSWGSFASPLVLTTLAMAERIAVAAGVPVARVRAVMTPIVRQTIANYLERGAAAAFTGPLARGDLNTIRKHLRDLGRVPGARDLYVALVRAAMDILPVKNREKLRRVLGSRY